MATREDIAALTALMNAAIGELQNIIADCFGWFRQFVRRGFLVGLVTLMAGCVNPLEGQPRYSCSNPPSEHFQAVAVRFYFENSAIAKRHRDNFHRVVVEHLRQSKVFTDIFDPAPGPGPLPTSAFRVRISVDKGSVYFCTGDCIWISSEMSFPGLLVVYENQQEVGQLWGLSPFSVVTEHYGGRNEGVAWEKLGARTAETIIDWWHGYHAEVGGEQGVVLSKCSQDQS